MDCPIYPRIQWTTCSKYRFGQSIDCPHIQGLRVGMPLLMRSLYAWEKNLCKIKWTNSLMRSYFISCLDHRKLIMFPAASEQCKVEDEVTKNVKYDIFVLVRILETRKRMAQCGKWFHHDCENIHKTVFSKKKKLVWFCCSCP